MKNYMEKEVGNYGENYVVSYPDFLFYVGSYVPNYMIFNEVSDVECHDVSYVRI